MAARNTPAGTNDFVYPSLIEARENASIDKAYNDARAGNISNPIVRDIIPNLDLDGTEDTQWDGDTNEWLQTPGVDGWTAGDYEVYEIDSDTGRSDDRVLTIYGFEVIEGGEYLTTVRFRGSDGQVFERAKVQGLTEDGDAAVDRQKTLRSPVSFGAQDNGSIEFEVLEAAESGAEEDPEEIRVKLLGVTGEKQGRRVGSRS